MKTDWIKIVNEATKGKPLQCKTEVFVQGGEYFSHLAKSINKANGKDDFIYILGWMLDIDFSLDRADGDYKNDDNKLLDLLPLHGKSKLKKLLTAAVKRGVKIRVLIWDNPIYYFTNNYAVDFINKLNGDSIALFDTNLYKPIKGNNALKKIKKNLPLIPLNKIGILQELLYPAALGDDVMSLNEILKINNISSHHEKVIIISNNGHLKAYCGGMDINKNRFLDQHDVHCCVYNTAAYEILYRFRTRWESLRKVHKPIISPLSRFNKVTFSLDNKSNFPYVKAIGTYNNPRHIFGKPKDRSAKNLILKIIKNAKKYIYIEDQYMISITIAKALHNALVNSKINVVILTQDSEKCISDIQFPNRKRHEFYQFLRYGKIQFKYGDIFNEFKYSKSADTIDYDKRVRFYQIRLAPANKWAEIVHSKLYIVDDEVMIIGSVNCSYRSMETDSETGVVIVNDKQSFVSKTKISIFSRYFSGSTTHKYMVNNFMDWEKTTPMITRLNFYGMDNDVVIRKKLLDTAKYLNKKSVKWPSAVVLNPVFINKTRSELLRLADYVITDKFRDPIWDMVEAKQK